MEIDTYIHIYKIFTYVFVYTHTMWYKPIILGNKKEQTVDIHNNINKSQRHFPEQKSQRHTHSISLFYLCEIVGQASLIFPDSEQICDGPEPGIGRWI